MTAQQRVAIIDYGMGNLRSVSNALTTLEFTHEIVAEPVDVGGYDKVILPGVGAFQEAMQTLTGSGMRAALEAYIESGRPVLGVCLGMQLFFSRSFEDGEHQGLGWIPGSVERLVEGPKLKVPHMGWNSLELVAESPLFAGIRPDSDVYFVHSYVVRCEEDSNVLARTHHGVHFPSIVRRENIVGMQFHPEKSQQVGLTLLKNFLDL